MEIGRIERWYKQFIWPSDTVFDVGANVGDWSAGFSRLCPRGNVIALEPQSGPFIELSGRFHASNVTAIKLAVGAGRGTETLHKPRIGSFGRHAVASMSKEFIRRLGPETFNLANGWDATETVEVTTLDALIAEHGRPSFIKIDVEGYELEVIAGLSQFVPLSLEFHPAYMEPVDLALTRLAALGFCEFNFDMFSDFRFVLQRWVTLDEIRAELGKIDKGIPSFGDLYAR